MVRRRLRIALPSPLLVATADTTSFLPDADPATNAESRGANNAGSLAVMNGRPGVWVPHAPMPGSRFRFAAASVPESQAIFVFGGTTDRGALLSDVEAFYDTAHPEVFIHYKEGSTAVGPGGVAIAS